MNYTYDRSTKIASMTLEKISEVLGGAVNGLHFVLGGAKDLPKRVDAKIYHMDRDIREDAKKAEDGIKKARAWIEKNKDLFGDRWSEVEREVIVPLANAEINASRVPQNLKGGFGQIHSVISFFIDDVKRTESRHKDAGKAAQALWDMRGKS